MNASPNIRRAFEIAGLVFMHLAELQSDVTMSTARRVIRFEADGRSVTVDASTLAYAGPDRAESLAKQFASDLARPHNPPPK